MSGHRSLDRRRYEVLERIIGLPPDEQEEILAASEPELAEDIRFRLAAAAARGTDFLAPLGPEDPVPEQPESVGPYRLLELLGEGGMGMVFLAEQQEPVRRRVAVKILRRAISGREARARFQAECHAMGRLNHPNVGKLLEAGTTEEGLPFFAMELIDGVPITRYCDEKALSLEERLRLFVAVCRGVDHAHNKLLLHRDIKPSNILVTEVDGRAVPKLIDFGIAKGLDSDLIDATLATGDRWIGTPAYMSPEALGLGGDVDTRSDVFSLGVVLYELLTGHRPWVRDEKTPHSALRHRIEQPIRSPSRRVGTLDARSLSEVAVRRGEEPVDLSKRLRGDLDWITLEAVTHEPSERYGSAADLAGDIERFLADEPVTARAPTTAYLLRKLIRRHRGRAIAGALLTLSLVFGAVGTGIGFVRARAEAERASQQAEAAHAARDSALSARQSSELLADFFVDLFTADSSSTTAAEMLERDIDALGSRLAGQPRAKGVLLQRVAGIYAEWGDLDRADLLLEEAVALLEPAGGEPVPEVIDAYETWVSVRWKQARFTEAGQLTERALAAAEILDEPVDPSRLALVLGQGAIAMLYIARLQQTEQWLLQARELLEGASESLPGRGPAQAVTQIGLSGLAYDRRQWQEGIDGYRRAAERLQRAFGPTHRRLVVLWTFIARGERRLGRFDQAEELLKQSLELGERYWFDDGHKLSQTLGELALVYRDQGRFAEAESLLRRSLESRKEKLPAAHPAIIRDMSELAWTIWSAGQGRQREAVDLLEQSEALLRQLGEPVYPHHLDVPIRLGTIALAQGRPEEAEGRFRQACTFVEGLEEPQPFDLGTCHLQLGRSLLASDRRAEAEEALAEAGAHLEAAGDTEGLAQARALL
ncbi:MAG: serine/threonine-protein kinase, partial [Holophagales bacterium]|nr:serine/threonine-protein kinase [Holophagales bacterium]